MKSRNRLDLEMLRRGLTESRSRAQGLIMAGKVRVDGRLETKAGAAVPPEAEISLEEAEHPWVSRGALKLEAALDAFSIRPDGLDCLDVGASTGGFTQLLLERGAGRVIALDVGHNQLDWKLRSDDRVIVMEGVNARKLGKGDLPFDADLITMDLSFISLRLVIPAIAAFLKPGGLLICLVKPQFEAGRHQVGRGGVVRDEKLRRRTIDGVVSFIEELGFEKLGLICSPITGRKGNREELAVFRRSPRTEDHPDP